MTVEPRFKEHATLNGHSRSVTSLRFSPDGKTLVSAGEYELRESRLPLRL